MNFGLTPYTKTKSNNHWHSEISSSFDNNLNEPNINE